MFNHRISREGFFKSKFFEVFVSCKFHMPEILLTVSVFLSCRPYFFCLFLHYIEKINKSQTNKITILFKKYRFKDEHLKSHWNMKQMN